MLIFHWIYLKFHLYTWMSFIMFFPKVCSKWMVCFCFIIDFVHLGSVFKYHITQYLDLVKKFLYLWNFFRKNNSIRMKMISVYWITIHLYGCQISNLYSYNFFKESELNRVSLFVCCFCSWTTICHKVQRTNKHTAFNSLSF